MIDKLRMIEIREYAEAIIYAFEFKQPIKSFCFNGKKELGYFLECMSEIKKSIGLIKLIEEERIKREQIQRIFENIVLI